MDNVEGKKVNRIKRIVSVLFFLLLLFLAADLSDRVPDFGRSTVQDQGMTVSSVMEHSESGGVMDVPVSGEDRPAAPLHEKERTPAELQQKDSSSEKPYVDHEILVQFSENLSNDDIITLLNGLGMSIEQILNNGNLFRIKIPESLGVEEALKLFHKVPEIVFSEPNFLIRTTGVPDDSSFSNQWGFHNTGQSGGTEDADINAPEAWDKITGSTSIVVAVVDEGIDLNHPDLSGNIWVNGDEIPGNGIDDDGNGYIDDVNGWDFNHSDATVYDGKSEDRHGTEVAGIIGAKGNNGIGTAGICWTVRIMPVKFIAYGSGTVANAILAMNYAVANGARVINCSWGGSSYSASLEAAFSNARDNGVLVVTSAGNSGKDTDTKSHYPSNYDLDNVLSVASTDKNDELSYFSNYGQTTVDLAAPGSSIYTTTPEGGYSYFSGTSAAAPFVTGAAALALSASPDLDYLELRDRILNAVDPISGLTTKTVTGGRLNLNNIISALNLADTDGDGIPDGYENQYGLNPNDPSDANADSDGDGLTNLQEYLNGTSPTNPDSDGDGLPDGYEITYFLDPTSSSDSSSDLDEDGLSNLLEYQAGTRIDLTDTDGDGIDDFIEFGPRNRAADSDGDGIVDALDLDSDDDGKTDEDEGTDDDDDDGAANYVDLNDADGPEGDQDGDGLSNSLEVTYMLYPNLVDGDGDGIDDPTEFGDGPTPLDSDGDEEVDALDLDSDNDGKLDADEGVGDLDGDDIPNYRDGDDSDGPLGDADGDGLLNQTESLYGMNVNLSDSDGDDIDDLTEFGSGSVPLDTDGDGVIDALDLDSDNDGSLDETENGKDSDGDGVPDRLDNDTATMVTSYGKLSIILPEGKGRLTEVVFLAQPLSEAAKPDIDFRYGGVQYKITGLQPGESVDITIQMTTSFASNSQFWKYDAANGYYEYPATISGNTLQFTITDGTQGDDDLKANGTIVDPGYIGVPIATQTSSDSSSTPASGGGGGGSGGCTVAAGDVPVEQGLTDLFVLLLPLAVLIILRFLSLKGDHRFRFRNSPL